MVMTHKRNRKSSVGKVSPKKNRRNGKRIKLVKLVVLEKDNLKEEFEVEDSISNKRKRGIEKNLRLKCKPKKLIKLARRRARIRRLKDYPKQKLDRGLQLKNGMQVLLASKTVIAVSTTNYSKLFKDFQSELIMHRSLRACIFYTLK
jgi:hypothetical protein